MRQRFSLPATGLEYSMAKRKEFPVTEGVSPKKDISTAAKRIIYQHDYIMANYGDQSFDQIFLP